MKKWTAYKVGGKNVKYATGTRPRADGIQIDFTDKTADPPVRRQITWDVDPGLQQNAEGADVKRDLILAEIKAAARGNGAFDLVKHFKDHETRRTIVSAPAPGDALFVDTVADRLNAPHLAVGTIRLYSGILDELRERWPTLTIRQLSVDHLRAWMTDLKHRGNTIKTIEDKLNFISPTIRRAVRRGEIPLNPIHLLDESGDFEPGQIEVQRKAVKATTGRRIDPYEIVELKKVFEKMSGHSNRLEQSSHMVRLYLNGPRTGEIMAAAWEDVDFVNGRIKICRSFHNNLLGARKNAKEVSVYDVELDEQGLRALEAQKRFTYAMKPYKTGTAFGSMRFIFRDLETGEPLWTHDKPFRDMWERLLRNACVRYRPPYHLRHTCATYALSCGEEVEWIARWKLGNSPEMVKKRYADWVHAFAKESGYVPGARLNTTFNKIGGA